MQNNEIIDSIMQNEAAQPTTAQKIATETAGEQNIPMSKIRVVTAKYKVYIVLLIIFICIFFLELIPDVQKTNESMKNSYQQSQSKLTAIQNDIQQAQQDVKFLWNILSNEKNVKECLNKKSCASLPENWKNSDTDGYDLTIPLSYLQLHSLFNEKMPVDEKKVLKNLNEYLIKQDIAWTSKTRVGDILKISIWDPESVTKWDQHFFEVPVDVSIKFTTIGDLTGFLYNVEKKLIDNSDDRILYKIQSVSYDIVSNDEPQITDISMLAYYYHDERFENVDEEAAVLGNTPEEKNDKKAGEKSEEKSEESDKQQQTSTEVAKSDEKSKNQVSGFLGEIFGSNK